MISAFRWRIPWCGRRTRMFHLVSIALCWLIGFYWAAHGYMFKLLFAPVNRSTSTRKTKWLPDDEKQSLLLLSLCRPSSSTNTEHTTRTHIHSTHNDDLYMYTHEGRLAWRTEHTHAVFV
uniref:Putative secreted protein n=1 Tax=Anopheles darlingi TaxID=43151 RepID=A0A2M4DH98_ANODA